MSTIKADPAELRHLASELRHSGAQQRHLGDQAMSAAASAQSPAAIGTVAEATGFATGARLAEMQTGVLASGTERVANLFEAADRGGGWFSPSNLMKAGLWGYGMKGTLGRLGKVFKNGPDGFRRKDWSRWAKELHRGRGPRSRFWGFNNGPRAMSSWGHARLQRLTHPTTSFIKFKNQGIRAVKGLSKHANFSKRVAPFKKFGGKLLGKVMRPFYIVQTYKESKARTPLGKLTSVAVSTFVTKNPAGFVIDLATGGQVTKAVDGVVSTISSVGDSDRLNEMGAANAKGDNGWAMQGIQAAGDGIAEGLYNGWTWVTGGH